MPRQIAILQLILLLMVLPASLYGIGLLSSDESHLVGGLLLALVITGFGALVAWAERTDHADGLGVGVLLQGVWARGPVEMLRFAALPIGIVLALMAQLLAQREELQPWGILLIWGIGCLTMLLGAWLLDRPVVWPWSAVLRTLRWEILAVFTISGLAFLVRVIGNDQIPATVHGDEGEMGLMARAVLRGELRTPFLTSWLSHPALWFFLQAGALRLFGDDIGGLRTLSALVGAGALPALYLFARPLYGRMVAMAAATILLALPLHLHFSRIALNNIVDPTLALFALAAFGAAWRTHSRAAATLGGLLLGFGQHGYFGGRVIPLVLIALFIHQVLINRPRVVAYWRDLLLVLVGAWAGFGPLLGHYLTTPQNYLARVQEIGLFQSGRYGVLLERGAFPIAILGNQLWRGIGAYTSIPDSSLFYGGEQPILAPAASVLFVCGLGTACWRWRRPAYTLLVVWVFATALLGGVLLTDPPQIPRYIIAAPAVVVLVALGANAIARLILTGLGIIQRALPVVMAVVSIGLAFAGIWYYGAEYTPKRFYGGARGLTAIGYHLQARRPDDYAIFLGPPYAYIGHGTVRFLAHDPPRQDVLEPITEPAEVPMPPAGMRPLFLALPARADELRIVARRYPGGRIVTVPDPVLPELALYVYYELP